MGGDLVYVDITIVYDLGWQKYHCQSATNIHSEQREIHYTDRGILIVE